MIRLVIDYDPNTDNANVQGIPVGQTADGRQVPLRGLCYAALERARDAVKDFSPEAKPAILVAQGQVPPVNRINGKG